MTNIEEILDPAGCKCMIVTTYSTVPLTMQMVTARRAVSSQYLRAYSVLHLPVIGWCRRCKEDKTKLAERAPGEPGRTRVVSARSKVGSH